MRRAFALSVKTEQSEAFSDDSKRYNTKIIALTFDDGPHAVYTPLLLDGLKQRGVKATFFVIGKNIQGNEAIIRRMSEEGHLIGNHTHTHVQLTSGNMSKACEEIQETNQKIFEITGKVPEYVRPPFGSWNEELDCQISMTPVFWTIDPLDWKTLNTAAIIKHVAAHAENGGIILLHDIYQSSVKAALEIIDTLEKQGYTFVTADELVID